MAPESKKCKNETSWHSLVSRLYCLCEPHSFTTERFVLRMFLPLLLLLLLYAISLLLLVVSNIVVPLLVQDSSVHAWNICNYCCYYYSSCC